MRATVPGTPLIDDTQARRIAAEWAVPEPGDAIALLAATGEIRAGAPADDAEQQTYRIVGTANCVRYLLDNGYIASSEPDDAQQSELDLRMLLAYVEHHGPRRSPVCGWPA